MLANTSSVKPQAWRRIWCWCVKCSLIQKVKVMLPMSTPVPVERMQSSLVQISPSSFLQRQAKCHSIQTLLLLAQPLEHLLPPLVWLTGPGWHKWDSRTQSSIWQISCSQSSPHALAIRGAIFFGRLLIILDRARNWNRSLAVHSKNDILRLDLFAFDLNYRLM